MIIFDIYFWYSCSLSIKYNVVVIMIEFIYSRESIIYVFLQLRASNLKIQDVGYLGILFYINLSLWLCKIPISARLIENLPFP